VLSSDPRVGHALSTTAAVAASRGPDVGRRLRVDQPPTVSVGGRHLAEAVVSGRYPVVLGLRPKALASLADRGQPRRLDQPPEGGNVRFLDLPEADVAATTSLLYFDQAPHSAAARLFANWVLTQEGQTSLTGNLPTNSARADVAPFLADGVGAAPTYYEPEREANYAPLAETQRLVRDLLRAVRLEG
jgi:ABC-type Fe3+ transport system substrate-binding protein